MKTKTLWLLTVILSLSGLSLSSCTDMADRTMDFCEQLRTTFAQRIERNAWMSRVNGVVMNMDSWYDVFNLKSGKLYRTPAERIHIW